MSLASWFRLRKSGGGAVRKDGRRGLDALASGVLMNDAGRVIKVSVAAERSEVANRSSGFGYEMFVALHTLHFSLLFDTACSRAC